MKETVANALLVTAALLVILVAGAVAGVAVTDGFRRLAALEAGQSSLQTALDQRVLPTIQKRLEVLEGKKVATK